jgi:uncharacterized membrane protein YraQ (UPF0718 family)
MKKFEFKGVKFLLIVVVLYILIAIFDKTNYTTSFNTSMKLLWSLIPIFTFIIVLTAAINYLLKPKQIMKHFGKGSGKKSTLYAILGGILSHGPMYAWYGMLSDMKSHGLRNGLIVTFIYARAVKLPLLPLMIGVFGIGFTIIINIYIIIFSIVQGIIMDKLLSKESSQ